MKLKYVPWSKSWNHENIYTKIETLINCGGFAVASKNKIYCGNIACVRALFLLSLLEHYIKQIKKKEWKKIVQKKVWKFEGNF